MNNQAPAEMQGKGCEKCSGCGKCCCKHSKKYAKLCPLSLGIASGIVYALGVVVLGWLSATGHVHPEVGRVIGAGGIHGAIYGFVGGFIAAALMAFIYNLCHCRGCKRMCHKCGSPCCKC